MISGLLIAKSILLVRVLLPELLARSSFSFHDFMARQSLVSSLTLKKMKACCSLSLLLSVPYI